MSFNGIITNPNFKNQGHRKQGSHRSCHYCPSGICAESQTPSCCPCSYHQESASLPPSSTLPQSQPQQPSSSQSASIPSIRVTEIQHNTITEWILPNTLHQAQIAGRQGSNACTVISLLTGQHFLRGIIQIPETSTDLSQTIPIYCQLIHEGNQIYDSFNMPINQPNLQVREVLRKSQSFQDIKQTLDMGFFFTIDIKRFLEQLIQQPDYTNSFVVLIVPPDKTLVICFNRTLICAFDSHRHRHHGGVIATGLLNNIQDFVSYLEMMVLRDWGTHLPGSNIAVLKKC